MLEFGHLWQDQDHRPARLLSSLSDKYLVMLGCSFPDWFARFMLCALKFDTLFERNQGRRGIFADELSKKDQELMLFLSRCNARTNNRSATATGRSTSSNAPSPTSNATSISSRPSPGPPPLTSPPAARHG